MRKIFGLIIVGMLLSSTSFARMLEHLPVEAQIAADLPIEELLKYIESTDVLKIVCAAAMSKDPLCKTAETIEQIMKFEIVRRTAVEESIKILNQKRSTRTEKQVRQVEEFIFEFGTKKERNRVAF
jgi:hypothetical protein